MNKLYSIINEEIDAILNEKRSVSGIISKDENIGELLEHIKNKYGFDKTFLSFRESTNVTKINRKNKYNTPTGLYTYKLSKFIKEPIHNIIEFRRLFPFASDRNYLYFYVIGDNANIISDNTSKGVLDGYVNRIQSKYRNNEQINKLCERWLNNEFKSYYNNNPYHDAHNFWLFIYDVVPYINFKYNTKNNDGFLKLCLEIGIDGFDDDGGLGWIHPAEKHQTVFFRNKIFIDEFILNPKYDNYYPYEKNKRIDVNQISDSKLIDLMNKNILGNLDLKPNDYKTLINREIFKNPKYINIFYNIININAAISLARIYPEHIKYLINRFNGLSTQSVFAILIKLPSLIKLIPDEYLSKINELDNSHITEIIVEIPEMLKYLNDEVKNKIEPFLISEILSKHPELIKHFINRLGDFKSTSTFEVLNNQPDLIEYFKNNLNDMNDDHIYYLLVDKPDLIKYFTNYKLNTMSSSFVTQIIMKQPDLLKYFIKYISIIDDYQMFILLKKQPRLIKNFINRLNSLEINYVYELIFEQPSLIEFFKNRFNDLSKYHVIALIKEHPELIKYFINRLDKISGYDVADLINKNPNSIKYFINRLNNLSQIELKTILSNHPQLYRYFINHRNYNDVLNDDTDLKNKINNLKK